MKKLFRLIRRDSYSEIYVLILDLIIIAILYFYIPLTWLIICSIILIIVSMIITHEIADRKLTEYWGNYFLKDKNITVDDLKEISPLLQEAIDLDKELVAFLDKYSTGKAPDYKEKELNKQWELKADYFYEKADKIFRKMDNFELLLVTNVTENLYMIVDVFKYIKLYKPDVEYMAKHPDDLIPYYFDLLEGDKTFRGLAINEQFYNDIVSNLNMDQLEEYVLSCMSQEELMTLANSSNDWLEKLYFYGFLDKEDKR